MYESGFCVYCRKDVYKRQVVKRGDIFLREAGGQISGTKYYLNKNYEIVDGKRVFTKKKVLYVSEYAAEEFGDGLYVDKYGDRKYIVNFL